MNLKRKNKEKINVINLKFIRIENINKYIIIYNNNLINKFILKFL